jgi:hypothetical protein
MKTTMFQIITFHEFNVKNKKDILQLKKNNPLELVRDVERKMMRKKYWGKFIV